MNAVLQILEFVGKHRWVVFVMGLVAGLVLGLVVGWYVFPVEFVNVPLASLRVDFRDNYLVWVAEEYTARGSAWGRGMVLGTDYNAEARQATLQRDIEQATAVLEELALACENGTAAYVTCDAVDATRLRLVATDLETIQTGGGEDGGGGNVLTTFFPVCLVLIVAILLLLAVLFILSRLRGRGGKDEQDTMAERMYPVEPTTWGDEGPPLAQFPTTYTLGDDHYDPSFSIELESGEFMGECGVGLSETIGVGAPNKITAFEVWLFDKSDIRTVTKVLMSDYAFNDEALRTKLAPKGEPVLVEEGQEVVLETKTLRVRARVVEAKYGIGNLPPNSFFERITIDLVAWVKVMPGEEGEDELMAGGDVDLLSSL